MRTNTRFDLRTNMGITSYAQNFEDVILWRALGHIKNGCYIDIGSQDPIVDSISLAFYENGWSGVHVEPTPHYAELLRAQRKGDLVIQAAVGNYSALTRFFEIPNTGISTANADIAEQHRQRGFETNEILVTTVMLADIFVVVQHPEIHWLKIDVEGFEDQVLSSWRESCLRPWVVVVESTLPLTQQESYKQWEHHLIQRKYTFVYFDGLNRFYLAAGHDDLKDSFGPGPNVFDGFSLSGLASAPFCSGVQNTLRSEYALAVEQLRVQRDKVVQQLTDQEKSLLASQQKFDLGEAELKKAQHELVEVRKIHVHETEQQNVFKREYSQRLLTLGKEHDEEVKALLKQSGELERAVNSQLTKAHHQLDSARIEQLKDAREQNDGGNERQHNHQNTLNALRRQHDQQLVELHQHERELNQQILLTRENAMKQEAKVAAKYEDQIQQFRNEQAALGKALNESLRASREQLETVRQLLKDQEHLAIEHDNQIGEFETRLTQAITQRDIAFNAQNTDADEQIARLKVSWVAKEQALINELSAVTTAAQDNRQLLLSSVAKREREFSDNLLAARDVISEQEQRIGQCTELLKNSEKRLAIVIQDCDIALNTQRQASSKEIASLKKNWANAEQVFIWKAAIEAKKALKALKASDSNIHLIASRQIDFEQQLINACKKTTEQKNELSTCQMSLQFLQDKYFGLKQWSEQAQNTLQAELDTAKQKALELTLTLDTVQATLADTQVISNWRLSTQLRKAVQIFAPEKPSNPVAKINNELLLNTTTNINEVDGAFKSDTPHTTENATEPAVDTTLPQPFTTMHQLKVATTSKELLELHDRQFTICAYHTLLGREPDPEGLKYYLNRIRSGYSKISILTQLYISDEGKRYTSKLPGLAKKIEKELRRQIPLLGWLFRLIDGQDGNQATARKLRCIENKLILQNTNSSQQLNRIEESLQQSHELIEKQTQTIQLVIKDANTHDTNIAHLATNKLTEFEAIHELSSRAKTIYFQLTKTALKHSGKYSL